MAKKILVVDDQKSTVDLLDKILSKEGFQVLTATDGESALKLAKQFIPDLILLDVMMPEMDGGDVMASLLEDGKLKNTPVIFLTGAVSEEEAAVRNKMSTGRLYLSKAGDIMEMVKVIKRVLGV